MKTRIGITSSTISPRRGNQMGRGMVKFHGLVKARLEPDSGMPVAAINVSAVAIAPGKVVECVWSQNRWLVNACAL